LDFALDGAKRMQGLLDGLLDYSRLDSGELRAVPVDCSELVEAVLDNLQLVIGETETTVNVDPLPVLQGDPTQLSSLFQNLVSNAIKFGPRGTVVHISAEREPHGWRFSVTDNGIGIDPQDAQRAFEAFGRLNRQDEYAGCGMGLALCKRIVDRHGGSIEVEPAPTGGSTFLITIPDSLGAKVPAGIDAHLGSTSVVRAPRISQGRPER
jgi:signal transduction histidine kinase